MTAFEHSSSKLVKLLAHASSLTVKAAAQRDLVSSNSKMKTTTKKLSNNLMARNSMVARSASVSLALRKIGHAVISVVATEVATAEIHSVSEAGSCSIN